MIDFSDRIYILDGAMGTMLQKMGLEGAGEKYNISHPDAILDIHRQYIEAGADIIETNTFGADREEALAGALLARKAADSSDRKVWVAGSLGPRTKSLSTGTDADDPSKRDIDFMTMSKEYEDCLAGLIEGGADLILLETCFDALNVKAAIYAMENLGCKLPVMVSASCADKSGRLLTGQTLEAFYRSISYCNLISFGLNCSMGGEQMIPLMREISSFACCATSCYPNAGLPDGMGNYGETPDITAAAISAMASESLVNIVGGCCGTTPEHIRAIAGAVRGMTPRPIPAGDSCLYASGLESIRIDLKKSNFTNIGERTNVAGSRKFARLIASGSYDEALEVAAHQIENGAGIIDINMDDAMLDSTREMSRFLRHISNDPAVAKAALMIDSSHFEAIVAGLENAQGRCIVNSLSLKEGEEEFLRRARIVKKFGAAVVVMAFDEIGQATDFARKTSICKRAYGLLTSIGFKPQDIIFDVNILSIGTGIDSDRKYAVDFIEAVRWIKENLPGSKTSGGVSNLSFSFRGNNTVREALHSVFLYHAIKAGLDMAIVNPGMIQIYDEIEPELRKAAEDLVMDRDAQALSRLSTIASGSSDKAAGDAISSARENLTLQQMLVKGVSEGLEEKVLECLKENGTAGKVIEGPLMEGMEKVGELFSEGRMFLPQVVKSARIMKSAVEILDPYLQAGTHEVKGKGKVLIATVKGDVHDIGKNITATVLRCNGFIVKDLGIMVDNDTILHEAEVFKPDIIGVSGLITPSLSHMEDLCRQMSARGMGTPLFVGGAAASALHTAVRLSDLYSHVYYCSDASDTSVMARKYMKDAGEFETVQRKKQQGIREMYSRRKSVASALPQCSADDYATMEMMAGMEMPVTHLPLEEVAELLDWRCLLAMWGFKAASQESPEARAFLEEAKNELRRMDVNIPAAVHVLRAGDFGHTEMPLWAFLNEDSPLGVFAVSVHSCRHSPECSCDVCSAHEDSLLGKTLKLCLADAASAWLQSHFHPAEGYRMIMPAIGYPSCPDHSLKKQVLESIPDSEELWIQLTESWSMIPSASVCGFVVLNKKARYI